MSGVKLFSERWCNAMKGRSTNKQTNKPYVLAESGHEDDDKWYHVNYGPRTHTEMILLKNKNQLDTTYYFIVLLIGSTCLGHYYAHQQELATIMLITTLVVSFLVWCRLEVSCGLASIVSGQQAKACALACSPDTITTMHGPTNIKFRNDTTFISQLHIQHLTIYQPPPPPPPPLLLPKNPFFVREPPRFFL